jgi:SAM-dependent methyltransferase
MLKNEAVWFGKAARKIPRDQINNVLDLGSSSSFFRNIRQPYINRFIFEPLSDRGINVQHTDIDLDVTDKNFAKKVGKLGTFNLIFACNLLEHVVNYKKAARQILSIMPEGGYLFVSCPVNFPYHPDPIDNMFRPTLSELAKLFSHAKVVKKAMVAQNFKVMFTKRQILFGKRYFESCLIIRK